MLLRVGVALGVMLPLLGSAGGEAALAQKVGSWKNSPPNSKAIIYDDKGRRLFWDDNGQVVGRYSFHTRKFTALVPFDPHSRSSAVVNSSPGDAKPPAMAVPLGQRAKAVIVAQLRALSTKKQSGPR